MIPYPSDTAFRQALEQRLLNQARAEPTVPLVRLRKAVAFEALLRRLLRDQPNEWLLKGGFALQLRLGLQTRTTKDIDLRAGASFRHRKQAEPKDGVRENHFARHGGNSWYPTGADPPSRMLCPPGAKSLEEPHACKRRWTNALLVCLLPQLRQGIWIQTNGEWL